MSAQVTTITAAETRRRTADLQSRLTELLSAGSQREELHIDYEADPLDQVRSSTDREIAVHRVDQRARLIHDIRLALAKVEDHSYGTCEECEEPISRRRLDAIPWARLCIGCQSAKEAAKQDGERTFEDAA